MRPKPVAYAALLFCPASALAGMVSYDLNDVVKLRLEEISFFIVVLLTCALGLKLLWNYTTRDFPKLPKLSYSRALAGTVLFGLLMVLVLSMISGARELLTPGAWHRQGISYKLSDTASEGARQRSMEQLRSVLFAYASTNGGRFPSHDFVPGISDKLWQSPDREGSRYLYVGGLDARATNALIACEPISFGDVRLILIGNGEIRRMPTRQIREMVGARQEP